MRRRFLSPSRDREIQRLLGDSDPRITMGIYTQVLDNEIVDVGLLLSKAAVF